MGFFAEAGPVQIFVSNHVSVVTSSVSSMQFAVKSSSWLSSFPSLYRIAVHLPGYFLLNCSG